MDGFSFGVCNMLIVQTVIDYDVLESNSYDALRGFMPGWCEIEVLSQMPLVYSLNNWDGCFGVFKLRKKQEGICEIEFSEPPYSSQIDRQDTKTQEILSLQHEGRKKTELLNKSWTEYQAQINGTHEHLNKVINLYFTILAKKGIKFSSPANSPAELTNTVFLNFLSELTSNVANMFQSAQEASQVDAAKLELPKWKTIVPDKGDNWKMLELWENNHTN